MTNQYETQLFFKPPPRSNLLHANSCLTFNPAFTMKTFAVDIYESGNLEPQTVFAYIVDEYPGEDGEPTADLLIKMPLYVTPENIRLDIDPYIEAFGLKLGMVKYELAPQQTYIHP